MNCHTTIQENLKSTNQSIKRCLADAGRQNHEVRLVAVSKQVESEKIREAYQSGQRLFGENRVQEILNKKDLLPSDIEWHMIGHLQTNKVKTVVNVSHLIHSIDSFRLLSRVHDVAGEMKKKQDILIQTNISGEPSKYGVSLETAEKLLSDVLRMEYVYCKGFMTIPPLAACGDEVRKIFSKLRLFRNEMEKKFNILLPELSIGMSSDYKIAISEGATLVRLGTAIFGTRSM